MVRKWFFSMEDVDNAVRSLKFGKASGADGITTERLRHAHPSIVLHLKQLFNLILLHGYVPDEFGRGIIVPLLKDRHGDTGKLDNYRGITTSSVISKVFEVCVCSKFGEFLTSHVLQFGYKKNISCQMLSSQCSRLLTTLHSVVALCLFHLWMPVRHLTALAMLNVLKN